MLMSEFITNAVKRVEAGDVRLYYLGNLSSFLVLDNAKQENDIRNALGNLALKKQIPAGRMWEYVKSELRKVWKQVKECETATTPHLIDDEKYSIGYNQQAKEFYIEQDAETFLFYPKRNGFCHHCIKSYVADCYCEHCRNEIIFSSEEQYLHNLQIHIFKNTPILATEKVDTDTKKGYIFTLADDLPNNQYNALNDFNIEYKGIDRQSGKKKYEIVCKICNNRIM